MYVEESPEERIAGRLATLSGRKIRHVWTGNRPQPESRRTTEPSTAREPQRPVSGRIGRVDTTPRFPPGLLMTR